MSCVRRARTGKIATLAEVGTDGERHRLWTDEAARRYNDFARGYPWKFDGFHGTDGPEGGYVNVPLDGDLDPSTLPAQRLGPVAVRPAQGSETPPQGVLRGYDVYDPEQVGFQCSSQEAKRIGTHFDTLQKGNGNGGHLYGTELPEDQKDALVEYLKTL